jgi:hypothetical protein
MLVPDLPRLSGMSACTADLDRSATNARAVSRVLRWTFRRADEAFVCELGLDRHESSYELRVNRPSERPEGSIEVFRDAIAALMRQAAIERSLVSEGWSLERFETQQRAA